MKYASLICLFTATGLAMAATSASAKDNEVRANQRFCLESGMNGGGFLRECLYQTMDQCIAGKTAPSDKCYRNPEIKG
jgi:uncharacterized protein DUF3551